MTLNENFTTEEKTVVLNYLQKFDGNPRGIFQKTISDWADENSIDVVTADNILGYVDDQISIPVEYCQQILTDAARGLSRIIYEVPMPN